MVGNLKVQEFMVIKSGGVPVFHFSFGESQRLDELLSGFLTAITSFATEFGERSVRSLSFKESEILYEQAGDVIFIFLVDNQAPEKVLRIVLRELSSRFLKQFEVELTLDVPYDSMFAPFERDVKEVFNYYENVLRMIAKLSDHVVPEVNQEALEELSKEVPFTDEFHRDFGTEGARVLDAINGKRTLEQIAMDMNLEDTFVREVIEYLTIWGVLRIYQLCPKLVSDDSRFDAFLDIIGLPNKDYQLLKRARPLCNGTRSILEISERLDVPAERLYDVLQKVGQEIEWNRIEIISMATKWAR